MLRAQCTISKIDSYHECLTKNSNWILNYMAEYFDRGNALNTSIISVTRDFWLKTPYFVYF